MSLRLAAATVAILVVLATTVGARATGMRDEPLCANSRGFEVVIHACDLARRLGEQPVLAAPRGDGALVLRLFIALPFQQPAILRVDIRSATDATMTLSSAALEHVHELRNLSPAEIDSIRKRYAAAPFTDVADGQVCNASATVFIEAAEPQRFRTTALCPDHKDDVELWGVVDDIMLNKFT